MAHVKDKKENESKEINWKKHFEDFVDITQVERQRAERRRDYRDLKQWTQEEINNLQERDQAPIVFDQYSKKVDGIVGLEVQRRSDPKAYPQNPKHQKASEAVTDALRYVESRTYFDATASEVFEDKIVEGYGGAIVEVVPIGEDTQIEVNHIPWDRIYFDPYSRKKDFSDCKYKGLSLWMDIDDAVALNPGKEDEIRNLLDISQYDDTTFEDRPSDWINVKRKRIRVNQEYYLDGDEWVEIYYAGDTAIIGPRPSPYLDCDDKPTCPIELESDFIDRDNNRWGYMERLIDVQDEINHRRSKALHMLSSVSLIAERGAAGDKSPDEVLDELRKGMSYIELHGQYTIDRQQELGQGQLAFYQDAQQAMDSVGTNPELAGRTEDAISGRAFIARQQSGMLELSQIFSRHSEWKERIYKQVWARVKQFWTEEKWVRVADNKDAMRFVGLNIPITRIEKLLEQQSGRDIMELRAGAGDEVDQFIQEAVAQSPLMGEVVETRNDVVKMHMDITIEEAPDTISIQQEQFETLAQLAASRADPKMFQALVKLSTLPDKEEILEMFESDNEVQAAMQAQQQQMQIEAADRAADIANKQAEAQKTSAETQKVLSEIPLNQAKAKDELASAMERVGKIAAINPG